MYFTALLLILEVFLTLITKDDYIQLVIPGFLDIFGMYQTAALAPLRITTKTLFTSLVTSLVNSLSYQNCIFHMFPCIHTPMYTFDEFLTEAGGRSSKSGLYPFGYDGIGNYTPADILTHTADAIYYLSQDQRLFKGHDGAPFSITHLTGEVRPHRSHGMPGEELEYKPHGMPGEERTPKETTMPPGKIVPFKQWVSLVTKPELLNPKKDPSQELKKWK